MKKPLFLECECQFYPNKEYKGKIGKREIIHSPQCGKLYVANFGGFVEIGFVKYPNRKKVEGAIILHKIGINKLISFIKR